ncbi:hypothetical protein ACFT4A_04630 [Streptomyces sp. NPDC057099]|uniref:hypothetical protein n=1 Tax=Streptomyces sp. NPDC057099 TaxID=3346019 RepID=UPI003645B205
METSMEPGAALDPLDLKLLGVSDQTVARRYRGLRTRARPRVLGVTDENRLGRSSWIAAALHPGRGRAARGRARPSP